MYAIFRADQNVPVLVDIDPLDREEGETFFPVFGSRNISGGTLCHQTPLMGDNGYGRYGRSFKVVNEIEKANCWVVPWSVLHGLNCSCDECRGISSVYTDTELWIRKDAR